VSKYKSLRNKQEFASGNYSIVPIRFEDRLDILKWRNEQIYHLRQDKPLTVKDQDNYFATVVAKAFEQDKPNQILFSFLENDICIGYGGLVHISWIDKNAEISFVMNTELENEYFSKYWSIFLKLIEQIAFEECYLHKIYIYAFDLRPKLYEASESAGFFKDAVFREHCFFKEKYIDVVIYSKIKENDKI
jgi:RimJ/RimL family protein N-acetyltransferase